MKSDDEYDPSWFEVIGWTALLAAIIFGGGYWLYLHHLNTRWHP
jgi:hypothetical protein